MHKQNAHLESQKTLFLRIFFALLVIFVISILGVVLMQGDSSSAPDTNTSTFIQARIVPTIGESFFTEHGWYSEEFQQSYTLSSLSGMTTYDFSQGNAIIDMPSSFEGQVAEGFGVISSRSLSIQTITGAQKIVFNQVTGSSARDGSTLEYAVIPYANERSLFVRGSATFVDRIITTLFIADKR